MKISSRVIHALCILALMSTITVVAWPQADSSFQTGTIMAVKAHGDAPKSDTAANQYDVSVKVGTAIYVILYTSPPGVNTVEYREGMNIMVSVQGDKLKFNDLMGNTQTVPILSKTEAPTKVSE